MKKLICLLGVIACLISWVAAVDQQFLVYIGTYTGPQSKGIYVSRLEVSTGALSKPELAAETPNPSFVTLHPNGKFLYAANEVSGYGGQRAGSVSAFSIDRATGKLTLLNTVSSRGGGPCHVIVDKAGRNALVANYGGGSIAVLPIGADGRLSEASAFVQHSGSSVDPGRQKGPHAHSVNLTADNRYLLVTDLGLDQVLVYKFDPDKGTVTPGEPAFAKVNPGAGPRHLAFGPGGKFVYVINELQSTLTAFAFDPVKGALKELQSLSTLPEGFSGKSFTAEVDVHPSGRFLYGSNRGDDSIVSYVIDPAGGKLKFIERTATGGKTPRNFAIDPTGNFLLAANQGSDSVVVFRIDTKTGRLTPTGTKIEVASPVCLKFLKSK